MRLAAAGLLAAVFVMGQAGPAPDPATAEVDAFLAPLNVSPASAAEVNARCDAATAKASALRARMEGDRRPATAETVLAPFDALFNLLQTTNFEAGLIAETHPDPEIRKAGEACVQKSGDMMTGVGLSRPIYDRLAAIVANRLDAPSRHVLLKQLANYRRAGVNKDAATRARLETLQNEIAQAGLAFARNIRESVVTERFRPEDLAGVPQDWLDAHKPGADGLIAVTTNYPDFFPVMDYADSGETRRRMFTAFNSRAYPANETVFRTLLSKRHELAQLLGYPNYAALITEDKMIGSPKRAAEFLDQVDAAAKPSALKDQEVMLARYRQYEPAATEVPSWWNAYLRRVIRKDQYALDSAVVRSYFSYAPTRDGILRLMETLFGVEIRPWKTPVWHESVSAYELYDGGQLIGRFYLDMHPRDGKFGHAAAFPIRIGVKGRAVPVSALICNFPATGPMDHEDAETFLHEFGHLMHWLFAGRQPMALQNFGQMEWDFVEAPSQMLEEWIWDYDTLKRFAVNEKGEPIPEDLVRKMNAGRRFGESSLWKSQLALSAVSLGYYDRSPEGMDFDAAWKTNMERYSLSKVAPGIHPWASFGHLDGYSAIYYTYVWSKAIALDLQAPFKAKGMLDRETALRYRREVLEPGGSKPAADLVTAFRGRPLSLEPLEKRLRGE